MAETELLDSNSGNMKLKELLKFYLEERKIIRFSLESLELAKTAIVEGLALRISQKKVPRILWDYKVLALDLTGLIAGAKYRGQFEERMKKIMIELEKADKVICSLIDYTIVGAGGATGSLDAANIFKPALARGDIQSNWCNYIK